MVDLPRQPYRLEIGVTLHETPGGTTTFVQKIAQGNVDGIPFELLLPMNKEFVVLVIDEVKYSLSFRELLGSAVSEHTKQSKLRPDPRDGSHEPRLFGIPFWPGGK